MSDTRGDRDRASARVGSIHGGRGVSRLALWTMVSVLSAAMLGYEILLARIASLLLTSDHLFLVLGLALLGLALGAISEHFIALRPEAAVEPEPGLWLVWSGGVMVLAILALVYIGPGGGVSVLAPAAALPFALAGLVLSRLFRLFPLMAGSLYGADLLGAAAGALLVPASIETFGPVQSIMLYGVVQAGLGFLYAIRRGRWHSVLTTAAISLFAIGLFTLNWNDRALGPLPVGRSVDKDLFRLSSVAVGEVETVDSRWSTFGRTDLVRFASDPDRMSIFVDGAAGTPMFRFRGELGGNAADLQNVNRGFAGALPLALLEENQKDSALIIGPGGGRDVLLALQAGFKQITAVDVNPQMVEIVKDYADYNGGIYTGSPNVTVVIDEGRRFLRSSTERYDLITLFMPITKSSRGLNAFALSESYLFTREAFRDYHRHLTDEGTLLVMAHGMVEAVKLATTAVETLSAEGTPVGEAMDHLYVLGSEMMPFFVLTKRPVTAKQAVQLHGLAHTPLFDARYTYIPGVAQEWAIRPDSARASANVPMMNPLLYDLAEGRLSLSQIERGLGLNLVPARDDRPFFSQFDSATPQLVFAVLWVSLAALLVAIFIPQMWMRLRANAALWPPGYWLPLWFAGIGVGFISIELVLFQKLFFHLGDPSRSLTILLASLLVGSGLGSLASTRLHERSAVAAALLTAAAAAGVALLLPGIFPSLQTSALPTKLGVAALLLVLQGMPMGMLFPFGLRVATRTIGPAAIPWMWAINGAASVVGSSLTVFVAIKVGYTWGLVVGAGCYLLVALAAYRCTGALAVRASPASS